MSKTQLKRFLNTLTHDQIAEMVLDLYSARREAKDYLDYFMNPDEEKMLDKARAIIDKEFDNKRGRSKGRSSVCRKAVKDFRSLHPHPDRVITLLLHLLMRLADFSRSWRGINDAHHNLAAAMVEDLLECIDMNASIDRHNDALADVLDRAAYGLRRTMREAIDAYRPIMSGDSK